MTSEAHMEKAMHLTHYRCPHCDEEIPLPQDWFAPVQHCTPTWFCPVCLACGFLSQSSCTTHLRAEHEHLATPLRPVQTSREKRRLDLDALLSTLTAEEQASVRALPRVQDVYSEPLFPGWERRALAWLESLIWCGCVAIYVLLVLLLTWDERRGTVAAVWLGVILFTATGAGVTMSWTTHLARHYLTLEFKE